MIGGKVLRRDDNLVQVTLHQLRNDVSNHQTIRNDQSTVNRYRWALKLYYCIQNYPPNPIGKRVNGTLNRSSWQRGK
jgi:hypothetical protein